MIPIKDDNPIRRTPWVTIAIIALNIAVFVYESSLGDAALRQFITDWSFVPARFLAAPLSGHELATLFTSMFMHAGWLHIGGNMLYLWIFGNNIEDRLGRVGFIGFYLTAGVIASIAQLAAGGATTIPQLGASGAIAGVLGAYAILYPRAAIVTIIPIFFFIEIARVPAFLVIGFWFLLQLGSGVASLTPEVSQSGGVAWFAHIGGFVTGFVIALGHAAWERLRRRYQGSGRR
ncbi:MAG: rhomboid family intramembrane serine protease [Actinomycetota bacterium]|nr:MAG: Peptidase S54 rhomboid domain [Actinomycetota bacterium]MDO8949270.1 rhomboid family intramembrane serine protease [Actinomycetota bacterium]MDP3629964.1 rhomboid family intramembrane serine protease [Actinomycetota bacterium]